MEKYFCGDLNNSHFVGRQLRVVVGSASHSESIEREWFTWEFSNLITGFLDTVSSPDPTPAVTERYL